MTKGLRDVWGLGVPQVMGAAPGAELGQFRTAFFEALRVINGSLQQTAPYGPRSQQKALDAQRQALCAAYQKVIGQLNSFGDGDTARVLSAADALRSKSQSYMQETESARKQWFEREQEIERVMERVLEMEEADYGKAAKVREVIEKIQSRAYQGSFSESVEAVDQFLPKLGPILKEFNEYRRELGGGPFTEPNIHYEPSYPGDRGSVPLGEYTGEQPWGRGGPTMPSGGGGSGRVMPLGEGPSLGNYNLESPFGRYQEKPTVPLGEYQGDGGRGERPSGGYGTGTVGGYGTDRPGQAYKEIPSGYGSDVIDHGYYDPDMWGTGAPWRAGEMEDAARKAWGAAGDAWDSARESASNAWDEASDAAADAYNWASEKANSAAEWVSDTADDAYTMAKGGDSRPLTPDEIKYAREIFGDHIDYSKIRVVKGSAGSLGSTRTIGDSVHMTDDEFEPGTMNLSKAGLETLIHEMTHVHQYQKNGWEYAPEALWEQLKAYVTTGDRNNAYDWEKAEKKESDATKWNPEQQGAVIEDYNKLLRRQKNGENLTPAELKKLASMKKHVDNILNAPPEKDIIDEAEEAIADAWDWTKETAEDIWDWGNETAEELVNDAEELWDDATIAAGKAWDDATEALADAWDEATRAAGDMWDDASEAAGEVWDETTEAISDAWDTASETVADAWDTATDGAQEVWDTASDAADSAWNWVSDTAGDVYDTVSDTAGEVWNGASGVATKAADYATKGASKVYDTVTDVASDTADYASEAASSAYDAVSNAASDAADYASEAASSAYDTVSSAVSDAWDSIWS